jgi:pilus assembly protein Flp/PilA
MRFFARFALDVRGATAVEYGILGGLLAVAIIAGFGLLSGSLEEVLNTITSHITTD